MKEKQLVRMLKEKGIHDDFMRLITETTCCVMKSSSEYLFTDLDDSCLSFIVLQGETENVYIICHSYYPINCYAYLMQQWAVFNRCQNYLMICPQQNEGSDAIWESTCIETDTQKKSDPRRMTLEDAFSIIHDIEITDIVLHEVKHDTRYSTRHDAEFKFYNHYGDIRPEIQDFFQNNCSIHYHFFRTLEINYYCEGTGTQIGVIEAKMTEKPYQLKCIMNAQMRKLKEKHIWSIPYFVTEFEEGKPHTYDNVRSVSCIVCFGSDYWSYESDDFVSAVTNEKLRHELKQVSLMIPGSTYCVSDDIDKIIDELDQHPLLQYSSDCLYSSR